MQVQLSFDIDEEALISALTELRNAVSEWSSEEARERALVLLNAIGDADRFEVDPDDEL